MASSRPTGGPRFAPGAIIGGRYRVVAPLGRGGMGEVYRVDDTKLGQAVALKFLPESFAADPGRLGRLLDEVRIGRQVSHPNVCRLYDIAEAEGHHFVSMEYVDGEDLASLLRRIGRLAPDKALEIARQLCAGLAAAHDRGVLHRDLKPANVMIDGRGAARLTDFGLAALVEDARAIAAVEGTPAYMAPEQLTGREVTFRSDLYALGLVLYEMLTGRRRFEGRTLAALIEEHRDAKAPVPLDGVSGLDPAGERVLARCLDEDPGQRPASARAVMAALPGGDPLQAALDAGETPSPALVAAAGAAGDLAPELAWTLLSSLAAGTALAVALAGGTRVSLSAPLPKAPDSLVDRAREIAVRAGYPDPPEDSAFWFAHDDDILEYWRGRNLGRDRRESIARSRPSPVRFVYRQGPRPLAAVNGQSKVERDDPPLLVSGMVELVLDPHGRLLELTAVPPQRGDWKDPAPEADWAALFEAAGLAAASFEPAAPGWAAPVDSDRKAAWDGSFPGQPRVPIHVEAASFRGRPVWFSVLGSWSRARRMEEGAYGGLPSEDAVVFGVILLLLAGSLAVARRNLRLGRADLAGAARVAGFVVVADLTASLLCAHHVADPGGEYLVLMKALGGALLATAVVGVSYLALEPYVRRRWPRMLIAWGRLLGGRPGDPLVGREVLVGALLGVGAHLAPVLATRAPSWLGRAPLGPYDTGDLPATLAGLAAGLLGVLDGAVQAALGLLCLLFFLRVLARKQWLAVLLFVVVLMLFAVPPRFVESLPAELSSRAVVAALLVTSLLRFGVLAFASSLFFMAALWSLPLPLEPGAWYAGYAWLALALLAGVAVYAFRVALGGKPALGTALEG